MMKNKIIIFCLLLVLAFVFIVSEEDLKDEKLRVYLENQFDGVIHDAFLGEGGSTASQRRMIVERVEKLNSEQQERFWNQWKGFDGEEKSRFWKDLDKDAMASFMRSYSENYGVEFAGFDQEMGFTGDSIGNTNFFLNPEEMKKVNEGSDNPWVKFERTKEGGVNTYKMTRADGNVFELKVKDGEPGYNIGSNRELNKVVSDGEGGFVADSGSPFSGVYDGDGSMSVDLTGDKPSYGLKFDRDSEGKLRKNKDGDYTGATFKFNDGREISAFNKYTKGKDGDPIYNEESETYEADRKDGTFVLDEDGSVCSIKNLLIEDPDKKIIGEFGNDVEYFFFDSEDELEAAKKGLKENGQGSIMVGLDDDGNSVLNVQSPMENVIDRSNLQSKLSTLSGELKAKVSQLNTISEFISKGESLSSQDVDNLISQGRAGGWLSPEEISALKSLQTLQGGEQLKNAVVSLFGKKDSSATSEGAISSIKNNARKQIAASLGLDVSSIPDALVSPLGLKSLASLAEAGADSATIANQFANYFEAKLSDTFQKGYASITMMEDFDEVVINGVGAEVVNGDITFKGNAFGGVSVDRSMFASEALEPEFNMGVVRSDIGKNSFVVDTSKSGLGMISEVGSDLVTFGGISSKDVIAFSKAYEKTMEKFRRDGFLAKFFANRVAGKMQGRPLDIGDYTFSVDSKIQADLLKAVADGDDNRFYSLLGGSSYALKYEFDETPYKGALHSGETNFNVIEERNAKVAEALSQNDVVNFDGDRMEVNVGNAKEFLYDVMKDTLKRGGATSEQKDAVSKFVGDGYSLSDVSDLAVAETQKAVGFIQENGKNGFSSISYEGGNGKYALSVDGKVHYINPEVGAVVHSIMPRVLDGIYVKKVGEQGGGQSNIIYDNSNRRLTSPGVTTQSDSRMFSDPNYMSPVTTSTPTQSAQTSDYKYQPTVRRFRGRR